MAIFGAEDQIVDADESLAAYAEIPGARTATIEEAGHSPHVETPEETARLILEFAADAGDEVLAPAPEPEAAPDAEAGAGVEKADDDKGGGKRNKSNAKKPKKKGGGKKGDEKN